MSPVLPLQLPPLDYPYDAFEPALPAQLVGWHHLYHHAAAIEAYNRLAAELARGRGVLERALLRRLARRGSSVTLHAIYWDGLRPRGRNTPSGMLRREIEREWGSVERWEAHFVAVTRIPDAGWALLAREPRGGRLRNVALAGDADGVPWIERVGIACDLHEHAYHAAFGPRRDEYVRVILDRLDWDRVASRLGNPPRRDARPPRRLPFGYERLGGLSARAMRWHHERVHLAAWERYERLAPRVEREAGEGERWAARVLESQRLLASVHLHDLFWSGLGGRGGAPGGALAHALEASFGPGDAWRRHLLALTTEGPPREGWLLLVWIPVEQRLRWIPIDGDSDGVLLGSVPVLAIDFHAHAYFYDLGADRAAYVELILNNLEWAAIAPRFDPRAR